MKVSRGRLIIASDPLHAVRQYGCAPVGCSVLGLVVDHEPLRVRSRRRALPPTNSADRAFPLPMPNRTGALCRLRAFGAASQVDPVVVLAHRVAEPSSYLATRPFTVHGVEVSSDVRPAVGIMDASRDMTGRRGLNPHIDLDFVKPGQDRLQIFGIRGWRRVSMVSDRPIAGQPQLQFQT